MTKIGRVPTKRFVVGPFGKRAAKRRATTRGPKGSVSTEIMTIEYQYLGSRNSHVIMVRKGATARDVATRIRGAGTSCRLLRGRALLHPDEKAEEGQKYTLVRENGAPRASVEPNQGEQGKMKVSWKRPGIEKKEEDMPKGSTVADLLIKAQGSVGTWTIVSQKFGTYVLPPDELCEGDNYWLVKGTEELAKERTM